MPTRASVSTIGGQSLRRRSVGSNNGSMRPPWRRSSVVIGMTALLVVILACIQGRFFFLFVKKTALADGGASASTVPSASSVESQESYICPKLLLPQQQPRKNRIKSASKLWMEEIETVLSSSQHPDDPKFTHDDWVKQLLSELPPNAALAPTVKSHPQPEAMKRVLQIVHRRMEALSAPSPPSESRPQVVEGVGEGNVAGLGEEDAGGQTAITADTDFLPPPLKIAVLGGSITEGNTDCKQASVPIPRGSIMGNTAYCAWPYRLESFLNTALGYGKESKEKVVKVVNMAEDGTSTTVKTPLLKYWMYPESLLPEGPDVIIHAYSASDALPFEQEEESLEDALKRELRTFVRAVQFARPCGDPPLVLHMADTGIVSDTARDSQIMNLEYHDAVSRASMADHRLAAEGNKKDVGDDDLPFGMAAHMAMMWVTAYNIADAVISYCANEAKHERSFLRERNAGHYLDRPLSDTQRCQDSPCVLAWLIGPTGTVQHAADIAGYIDPFLLENTGWSPRTDMSTGYSRKGALMAIGTGAKIVLEYNALPLKVRVITVMAVRSYGELWKDSLARFTVSILSSPSEIGGDVLVDGSNKGGGAGQKQQSPKFTTSFDMSGTHGSASDITFPFELDLGDNSAQPGDTLRIEVELVSGQRFKILGMMFCQR